MGCHVERTGLAGVISWDCRGWEQNCGDIWDLGAQNAELGRKPHLQQGNEKHPVTNIFEQASAPRKGHEWENSKWSFGIKKWRCTLLQLSLRHWIYSLWQSFMSWNPHATEQKVRGKKMKEKKRSIEKQCSVTQQMQKARSVQPVATVSHSYLHNGFPNVLKWLLHKFTDAVDLPSGYDKVLWLIRLQHQPHGLREDKQSQIQCICKWPLWYMTLYCCILDLEITYTHTPS